MRNIDKMFGKPKKKRTNNIVGVSIIGYDDPVEEKPIILTKKIPGKAKIIKRK
ncbi:MAG: hypothetical protein IIB39_11155 [Candidatus Marinimicrobia bacterium]|nr:hypothetical protein [Candidatus Neomarinimicrobiota bacterium]